MVRIDTRLRWDELETKKREREKKGKKKNKRKIAAVEAGQRCDASQF